MIKILITGSTGQLASSIRDVSNQYLFQMQFEYRSSIELDISDQHAVNNELLHGKYDYCINCAAYTNVDGAETDPAKADAVNHMGAKNLAVACQKSGTVLVHISTDFVFDGARSVPYLETDIPRGLGIYGTTKMLGEGKIMSLCEKHFIIRTSWLYSEHGKNFFKSMLKYGKERDQLKIVFDQIGTPTYAKDLAVVLLELILNDIKTYGIYHFSNEGVASWYDFAMAIFEMNNISVDVRPIRSVDFPLPAKRPSYSVLDKSKIKKVLQFNIPHWRTSLATASSNFKVQTIHSINL